jgi:hypothetical protein
MKEEGEVVAAWGGRNCNGDLGRKKLQCRSGEEEAAMEIWGGRNCRMVGEEEDGGWLGRKKLQWRSRE